MRSRLERGAVCAAFALVGGAVAAQTDPLPSWRAGPAETAIIEFVEAATLEGGADFVPAAERIAVFDNDGTLWVEQPAYTQAVFAVERVRALAPEHPEWAGDPAFEAAIAGDAQALAATGTEGLLAVVMASHAGTTTEEFAAVVDHWIAGARHPRFERPYTELVYQPMLELLDYLRANGFRTFIVSGGGIEFMRPWADDVYGIPPEQIVGSSIVTEFELRDGEPVLVRLPEIDFVDDKAGKPVGIQKFIGRRPILAFGNSDGDLQMLQWTTAGDGRRLGLVVHHDDARREYAYDRDSHVSRLDQVLDLAPAAGWVVVSMQDDWERVFAWE